MLTVTEKEFKKAATSCKAKTGVGCDGYHSNVPLDFTRNRRKSGGILGEGGAAWEMAAASLHDIVFPNPKECHQRGANDVAAYDDSLVGSLASARGLEMATIVPN